MCGAKVFCLILMERWWIPCLRLERAWSNWARRHGLAPEEVLAFIHGKQAITSLRHFMAGKSEADIAAEFTRLEHIEPRKPKVLPRFRGQSPYSII
ncbi:putative phosphatase/phosphohexomutase [Escherichia coli]|uniref:Putative phosphatase/phosphohexomutase n=1 Tax=Escherichia coli TaxID=562 RepID=A0A376TV35_ECOLX|nr:putative phosphatase/phosphohexomutase [Escherichia coli]